MKPTDCPELELLFEGLAQNVPEAVEHLASCEACAQLVEGHRQLEKDLLRLADPLPPPDFVQQVMARVEKAPAPLRREVRSGLVILGAALVAAGLVVFGNAAVAGAFGNGVADAVLWLREAAVASGHGAKTIWNTAALPVVAAFSLVMIMALVGLKKLLSAPTSAPSSSSSKVSA